MFYVYSFQNINQQIQKEIQAIEIKRLVGSNYHHLTRNQRIRTYILNAMNLMNSIIVWMQVPKLRLWIRKLLIRIPVLTLITRYVTTIKIDLKWVLHCMITQAVINLHFLECLMTGKIVRMHYIRDKCIVIIRFSFMNASFYHSGYTSKAALTTIMQGKFIRLTTEDPRNLGQHCDKQLRYGDISGRTASQLW